MSFSLSNLGNWWGAGNDQAQPANPMQDYATKMKAAMGAQPAQQSPLVSAYTPPAYQTTPPHVDINAVIAAMNAQKAAAVPPVAGMPMVPGGMPGEGASNGPGDVLNGDASQNAIEAAGNPNVGGTAVESVGYQGGGYTGDMPTNMPAGMVHGQEEVISAPATKAVGRKTLDKINEGDPESIAMAKKVAERVGKRNDGAKKGK